jgi:transcriptional regulator with XRE-family HTH domain
METVAYAGCPFEGVERYKNIVGQQVRKIRYQRGLKQRELAAKLEVAGWRIDRAGVAKIESRLVKVSDYQQIYLARVLQVTLAELFPPIPANEQVGQTIQALLRGQRCA